MFVCRLVEAFLWFALLCFAMLLMWKVEIKFSLLNSKSGLEEIMNGNNEIILMAFFKRQNFFPLHVNCRDLDKVDSIIRPKEAQTFLRQGVLRHSKSCYTWA